MGQQRHIQSARKIQFYLRSNYSEVNTTDAKMTSLAFSPANVLYGTHDSTKNTIQSVNQTTGARTLQAATTPSLNIKDISGINTSPRPSLPDCYAVGGDNSNIYRFDPATGVTYVITATAPFHPAAIARDPVNNILFYIENIASNWRLASYSVSANTHNIITTVGNGTWKSPDDQPAGQPLLLRRQPLLHRAGI